MNFSILKDKIPTETAYAMFSAYRLALKNKISEKERDDLLQGFASLAEQYLSRDSIIISYEELIEILERDKTVLEKENKFLNEKIDKINRDKAANHIHVLNRS